MVCHCQLQADPVLLLQHRLQLVQLLVGFPNLALERRQFVGQRLEALLLRLPREVVLDVGEVEHARGAVRHDSNVHMRKGLITCLPLLALEAHEPLAAVRTQRHRRMRLDVVQVVLSSGTWAPAVVTGSHEAHDQTMRQHRLFPRVSQSLARSEPLQIQLIIELFLLELHGNLRTPILNAIRRSQLLILGKGHQHACALQGHVHVNDLKLPRVVHLAHNHAEVTGRVDAEAAAPVPAWLQQAVAARLQPQLLPSIRRIPVERPRMLPGGQRDCGGAQLSQEQRGGGVVLYQEARADGKHPALMEHAGRQRDVHHKLVAAYPLGIGC
mmetsp:Transcript_6832/g.17682  ORF Transcript_6832/g.17682 Transcript_6832/m.17682 type:complete len:326 (-) Transcript_6832:3965-4942(-)